MRRFTVQRCDCRPWAPRMSFLGRRGHYGQQSVYLCRHCGRHRVLRTQNCTKHPHPKGLIERLCDAIFGG